MYHFIIFHYVSLKGKNSFGIMNIIPYYHNKKLIIILYQISGSLSVLPLVGLNQNLYKVHIAFR